MGLGGQRLGFLGAGQMAQALARGWLAANLLDPTRLAASDPNPAVRALWTSGATITANNLDVVARSEVLFLAVKPQMLPDLLAEIGPAVTAGHLVVSIAAGVTLATLHTALPAARLVRAMPNTPCLVGASATGFAVGDGATPADVALVETLFGAVGQVVRLSEGLLDAVTGLSGSGPAFVYVVIEALADGGVRMGLPRDVALTLAAQTVLGAATMVLQTHDHPGQLKDRVASPAGTTIAGLHALERAGVRGAFMDAVQAATHRASELSRPQ